jgi:uncharacterized protein (TIGR02996 family)
MSTSNIASAAAALEAGKLSEAIASLVEEWKTYRAPELARHIDLLVAQHAQELGPLPGSTRKARMEAFDEHLKHPSRAHLHQLLDALPTFSVDEARPRLARVREKFGADPRLVTALLTLLSKPPNGWRGAGAVPFWRDVLSALEFSKDPRLGEAIPPLLAQWNADLANMIGWVLRNELPKLQERVAKWQQPPFAVEALAPLRGRVREKKTASLETVFANPADEGTRQVLADALTEQGDVRGEFIALQLLATSGKLTAAQRSRQAALVKQHARAWLGRLDDVLQKSGVRFERGFPVSGVLASVSNARAAEVVGLSEWATFEELDAESWRGALGPLVTHEAMRSLKVLHAASPAVFASPRPLLLEEVSFTGAPSLELAIEVLKSKMTPRLKRLALSPSAWREQSIVPEAELWAPLWELPVMRQLETLTVPRISGSVRDWFELVGAVPGNVQDVRVEATPHEPWAARFSRRGSGWHVELRYGWNSYMNQHDYERLDAYLAPVKRVFERATFDLNRSQLPPDDAVREQLARVLKRRLGAERVDFLEPGKRARAGRR